MQIFDLSGRASCHAGGRWSRISGQFRTILPPPDEYPETFAAGLKAYRAGEFDRADSLFRSATGLRPDDPPSLLYLKRIADRRTATSGEMWDGMTDLSN